MSSLKIILTIALIFVILKIVGFFSGSETAYLSIPKIKFHRMIQERRKNAKIAAGLKDRMDELLTVVLIGTNFMNSLASSLATSLAVYVVGAGGIGIATVVITFFATIFGQIVPKTIAGVHSEKVACSNAVPLLVLEKSLFPVVWIFTRVSKMAAEIAKKFWKTEQSLVTEEELVTLIDMGEKEGTLEKSESRMLNKIFKFTDLSVRDIMKHRSLVQSVKTEATRDEVIQKFNQSGLKMIAVYNKFPEQIVGVIGYKAVLFASEKNVLFGRGYAAQVMKNALFVPVTFSALELLSKFKKMRTEFAVALDEQGCTAGVVTMDDILRVVFGRLSDDEKNVLPPESRIKFISANEFIIPGDITLDDINDILKFNLESEYFTTFGGWLLERFGALPSEGEAIRYNGILFAIEEQASRKIISVRVKMG
ncbi:MAG: HlyC/CorC family transporter [Treponema sp.]|nr:HlyC/CorC family transporter [Treponema sp.]